ncbi:Amino acid/polyamine transporter I [Pleurostoma richardsiae]|uniref:Amino acid/polyamine transporter I n=1 Tax=Pleurostoma richardsiae TaxID=41990 RepID=A0AA38VP50_9PEZI|nr:Amino acid/polyamine transporter I [Pleurostoma richardsiae]
MESPTAAEQATPGSVSDKATEEQGIQGQMRKRFNFTSLYYLFVTGTAGWEAIIASLYQVLVAGGPTVLVWGFVISAVAACCIAFSLAEFASIWPTAAGQYHWAVALAPPKWKITVGWYSSWILLTMNLLSSISAIFAGAFSLQALIMISIDGYSAERWQTYLIFIAIISISLCVNVFIPRALHYLSLVGTAVHVLGFFTLIVTLLATTKEKNSAKVVFGTVTDYTGYNSAGVAFMVGMLPMASGFTTMDLPARYSEETAKPHTDVSRAMFWGVLTSSVIGLVLVLVIAFCMGDPSALLESEIASLSPLAEIVYASTGSLGAAIVFGSVIVVVAVLSAIDCMGSIARIIMAQARDQGLPFSQTLSKIHLRWNTPVNATILAASIQAAISAIYIGNSTAFYGILSGVITLQVMSFGLPIAFHLFRKKSLALKYGPWSLGRWGWLINAIGLLLYLFSFVAVSLPTSIPVTAQNMNYSAPIVGIVLLLATGLYLAWGRPTEAETVSDKKDIAS